MKKPTRTPRGPAAPVSAAQQYHDRIRLLEKRYSAKIDQDLFDDAREIRAEIVRLEALAAAANEREAKARAENEARGADSPRAPRPAPRTKPAAPIPRAPHGPRTRP